MNLNLEKVQKATIGAFTDVEDFLTKLKDYKFRACGVGVIGNKGEKPKGVVCTDVNPTSEKCGDEQPENTVCLQWSDRDNNICMGKSKLSIRTSSKYLFTGDYGGPIWAYVCMCVYLL